MWLDSDAVLHIIKGQTRYSVAKFITAETAESTWELIMEYWIFVFTGYPLIISHDQGP